MVEAVATLTPVLGVAQACAVVGVSRATHDRRARPRLLRPRTPSTAPRALGVAERHAMLDLPRSERFRDASPAQVSATLLDEGLSRCSERTMYRLLAEAQEVRDRRAQARHPASTRPELLAERPNEVWSWDITKLLGPAKGTHFYLYVALDIYSRYVVGWMVAHRERAELARRCIAETAAKQGIDPGQLPLPADRGSSMTS